VSTMRCLRLLAQTGLLAAAPPCSRANSVSRRRRRFTRSLLEQVFARGRPVRADDITTRVAKSRLAKQSPASVVEVGSRYADGCVRTTSPEDVVAWTCPVSLVATWL